MAKRNVSYDEFGRVRVGKRAAGLLIIRGDGKVLLVRRSDQVLDPGTWSIPGGAIDPGESAFVAALVETLEELGPGFPRVQILWKDVYKSGGFTYTTFLVLMDEGEARSWHPKLNWENNEWNWFGPESLPAPMHPNVKKVLEKVYA